MNMKKEEEEVEERNNRTNNKQRKSMKKNWEVGWKESKFEMVHTINQIIADSAIGLYDLLECFQFPSSFIPFCKKKKKGTYN